jgi:cytochrome c
MLEKNAYVVEGVAASSSAAPEAAAPKGPPPLEPLLAAASVEAGQKTARVCGTCHSFGKGEAAKIGPNLYGIIGSKHAHMEGFDYSDAMKAMPGDWSFDELNEFLYSPRAHVPGTKMTFAGLKNDQDRANVIAYLSWLGHFVDQPLSPCACNLFRHRLARFGAGQKATLARFHHLHFMAAVISQ